MVTRYLDFTKTILRYDFGESASLIAETLTNDGKQTRDQLTQRLGLGAIEVKKSLLVLLAHGLITAKLEESKVSSAHKKRKAVGGADLAPPRPVPRYTYKANTELIRYRISYARFIHRSLQLYGKEGEFITETFVQHGKLLLRQLLDLCVTRLLAPDTPEQDKQTTQEEMKSTRQKVEEVFRTMVLQGFIGRANTLDTGNSAGGGDHAKKKRKTSKGTDVLLEDEDSDVFWYLRHERFVHNLRNVEIVQYVEDKINPTAAAIVSAIMDTYPQDLKAKVQAVGEDEILELIKKTPSSPSIDEMQLDNYLEEMCSDYTKIMKSDDDGYYVDIEHILHELRSLHAQSIVIEQIDPLAGRIFRLLIIDKRLEEKQVGELSTAPKKRVREVLYSMLKNGFVSLQEVPKTPDRHAARTFYLWGVPLDAVFEMLIQSFYFTWTNLKHRAASETSKVKQINDKVDVNEQLTAEEAKEFNRWKRGDDRLQSSMLKIDKLIMLFKDF